MKITEIENKIISGDCSQETMELFKTALKRVPKSNRCQHCYTTAVSMKPRYYIQAVELIQYGLDSDCTDWLDVMRSYHNMAILHEQNCYYDCALDAYNQALLSVESAQREHYEAEYYAHMMRMEMHISRFKYTENLHKYYDRAIFSDEFCQSFQKFAFYKAVAEIIIALKNSDFSAAENAFLTANRILRPDNTGSLTQLLRRNKYKDSAGATKESLSYLKKAAFSISRRNIDA